MPNHVKNIITASPAVIDGITRAHTDEERAAHAAEQEEAAANYKKRTGEDWPFGRDELPERFVDFDLVVPSPPNKEEGGCNGKHEDGVVCWYQWNLANWGTKWGGYDTEIMLAGEGDLIELQFNTAWSHPAPVIQALSEKFPDEKIRVAWADEDLGSNCGSYVIQGGERRDTYQPNYGPESLDFASQLRYGMSYEEFRKEQGWDVGNSRMGAGILRLVEED